MVHVSVTFHLQPVPLFTNVATTTRAITLRLFSLISHTSQVFPTLKMIPRGGQGYCLVLCQGDCRIQGARRSHFRKDTSV